MREIRQVKDINRCASFTGHRKLPWGDDENHPGCVAVMEKIRDTVQWLYRDGITAFHCGLALGADTLFAETVLRLQHEGLPIYLIGAIPNTSQTIKWTTDQCNRYQRLYMSCAAVYVDDEFGAKEFASACLSRNRWMVDNSRVLIALINDGSTYRSGTVSTVQYALRLEKAVIKRPPL